MSVRRQCELLQVNRSSVYYETKEPTQTQRLLKEEIMGRIDYWHTELPAMGSRKIAAKLRDEGYKVGRKLVRSYMREMEIYAIYPKPNLSKNDGKEGVVPYLLRYKTALFPNQYWSIDITYIKMYRHHMYLVAIIDWYSRKIVGWRLADTLETYHVLDAVRDAVERYGTLSCIGSCPRCCRTVRYPGDSQQRSRQSVHKQGIQKPFERISHHAKHGRAEALGR